MQILLLSHRTPFPPHKGNQIRPFNVLKALRSHGHQVHLLAFAEVSAEIENAKGLAEYCSSYQLIGLDALGARARAFGALLTGMPPSLAWFNSREMHAAVAKTIMAKKIDAVVVYSSTMSQYVPESLREHCFVDMADVDSEKWLDYATESAAPMKWVYRLEGRRLRKYEYWIVRNFGVTSLHTQREIDVLTGLSATEKKRLIPITNGVDIEKFSPGRFAADQLEQLPENERRFFENPESPWIVFTGAMDYRPNAEACIWFANQIFPGIRSHLPAARFVIVGSKPTPQVLALAGSPGVEVTGFVDDVRPYLAAATVCVIPLRIARGVQNKALEAMASGRVVIATKDVIAGVGAIAGEHLLMARDEREFTAAVLRVVSDVSYRQQLEKAAREFVVRNCTWEPLMNRLVELVESVSRKGRGLTANGSSSG